MNSPFPRAAFPEPDAARGGAQPAAGARAPAGQRSEPSLSVPRPRLFVRWLPSTMAGLVAVGCLLAAAPLFLSVLVSGIVLQQQAKRSETIVSQGLRLERLSAELLQELENLQRGGLQYVALEDAELLPVIERRRSAAEETLREIESAGFPESVTVHVRRVQRGLSEVAEAWTPDTADAATLSLAMDKARSLNGDAQAIVAAGRETIDARVAKLQRQSEHARSLMRFAMLALVPLTALLTYGFSSVVTRPLNSLRASIAAIGTSDYARPVEILYPREMSRVGEKLDWLRRRLATLEADKDRFLRHVSHELKTPLASLREGADLMTGDSLGALNAQQREVAAIIAEAAEELESQIHSLLTYAEWRSGQREADLVWFGARELIDDVITAQRLPMAKRGLRVWPQLEDGCALYGQRAPLRVALDNLVSNAVKHAPPGSAIEIAARCAEGLCTLSVRDSGRGIAPQDRQRILEPFFRGSELEEHGVRGTGVGLSIVVETIKAHGGDLEVQDAQPGTRMVMSWPCPPRSA